MKHTGLKRAAALVAALAATAAIGCGGDGGNPEDVVSATYEAAADGDAAGVCENLSATALESAGGSADECEEAIEPGLEAAGAFLGEFEVGDSSVDGDTGTVEVSFAGQTEEVPVVQEDGEWKLDEGL